MGKIGAPSGCGPDRGSAASLPEGGVDFDELHVSDGRVYVLEMRPHEDGRSVLVAVADDGTGSDVVPAGWSIRSRVHEYGGGALALHDEAAYFVNADDQRIYRQPLDAG